MGDVVTTPNSAESRVTVATRNVVLHAMANGLHEKLCGSPPSCGESWRKCSAAGIRHEEVAAMMTGLRNAGLRVVR